MPTATAPAARTDPVATTDGGVHRHLAGLHLDHLDLEVLGFHIAADGFALDLDAVPSDERRLTGVLAGAMRLLHRLRSTVSAVLETPIERLRHWLVAKLLHLVRVAAGRLMKQVAGQLGERAAAKARPKGSKGSDATNGTTSGSRGGKRTGGPAGMASGRTTRSAGSSRTRAGSIGTIPRVPTPQEARAAVQRMPSEQVRRLAEGIAPKEMRSVVGAQPPGARKRVAASIQRLEGAAEEAVHGS